MLRNPRLTPILACLLVALAAVPAAAQPAGDDGPLPLLAPLAHGRAVALPELDPEVPSPADFLGYPLGTRFTHHHEILAYLERLAEASPRVETWQYGETYEGRPLTLVAISAPENVSRLEALRTERLRLADPRGLSGEEIDRLAAELPVVAWLAYGVHGNESSSAEAAMAAAYALAAASSGSAEWQELLAGTIVLIDPLVNPDGRERYVSFYEQARGRLPDPDPGAAEHWEPWPGGRQNHYLIDLNRDWSWASQRETRDRLAAYRAWEPQVYVDYHEMFTESTYFFPPAADPVNPLLDERTVAWLDVFGRANAEAFDRQGWPYYKAETFDLYYPGYGDSYPGFRGAVGMTYEMAGHGRAGLAFERRDGTVLTLADRIAQHFTTSLATVRTAAENRERLLATFARARADAASRSAPAYLWPSDAPEAGALAELLELHGV
ncbi:MAG TPA: M14 family zinc carboxypeptidase, partial [Thermoanaerobaculia bacterium]|nr:M14 family zinc carboxypeptidase [Thermoanaerobaculia bacterium]